MRRLIELHQDVIGWCQDKLGLSDYGLLWASFGKGFVVGAVVASLL
jgi:hypothetical protein